VVFILLYIFLIFHHIFHQFFNDIENRKWQLFCGYMKWLRIRQDLSSYQNEWKTPVAAATLTDSDLRVVSNALTQLALCRSCLPCHRPHHHVDKLLLCQRATVEPLTCTAHTAHTAFHSADLITIKSP